MAEYSTARTIGMAADALFAWLSDLDAMPSYVPAVARATLAGREEVYVTLHDGTRLAAWLRVYQDSRQLAWGTWDGAYRGELHVVPRPAATVNSG